MNVHWIVLEIVPYVIFIFMAFIGVIIVSVLIYSDNVAIKDYFTERYFKKQPNNVTVVVKQVQQLPVVVNQEEQPPVVVKQEQQPPDKVTLIIAAAYFVISISIALSISTQMFIFERIFTCTEGLNCFARVDGILERISNCSTVTPGDSIVCYDFVIDPVKAITSLGSLLFMFDLLPLIAKSMVWKRCGIFVGIGFLALFIILCFVSAIVRCFMRNVVLAIEPIIVGICFIFLLPFFLIMLSNKPGGCGCPPGGCGSPDECGTPPR